MNKRIAYVILIFCLAAFAGCSSASQKKQGKLTIEKIKELAVLKGEDLTWSDFEPYESIETGSGITILCYETDGPYQLWIGGSTDEEPLYIRIVSAQNTDDFIDIRDESIESINLFLSDLDAK